MSCLCKQVSRQRRPKPGSTGVYPRAGGGRVWRTRIIIDRKLCDYSMFALFSTRSLASCLRRQVSRQRRPKPGSTGVYPRAGGGRVWRTRIIIDRKLCDYSMFALFSTRSLASYLRRQVSRQRRPKPGSAGVYPRAGGYDVREQLLIESYVTIQCSLFFRPAPWRHTCAGRYPASGAAVWIPAGVYPRAGGGGYDVNECFW